MKILSIETSSEVCSVAILEDKEVIKEISVKDGLTHSVNLMPQIDNLFTSCNLTIHDIDLFACDKGPGSFTGIRIGISTIKALADVTNKPCLGISSLRGLTYNCSFKGYICSLIDAKNNNVYFSLFNFSNGIYNKLNHYLSEDINTITEILKKYNKSIFFVGNGSIVHKDMLKSVLGDNAIFSDDSKINDLSAASIGMAAFDVYSYATISNDFDLSPLYLKKSSAERLLEEKENGYKN